MNSHIKIDSYTRVTSRNIVTFYACIYLHVDILRRFDNMVESIIPQLPTSFEDVTDPDGKSALIWILGEYGEVNAHCIHVLVNVAVHLHFFVVIS